MDDSTKYTQTLRQILELERELMSDGLLDFPGMEKKEAAPKERTAPSRLGGIFDDFFRIPGTGPAASGPKSPEDEKPSQPTDEKAPVETAETTAKTEPEKTESTEPQTDPLEDLDALTGMTDLKKDVRELINLVKMQKLRQEKGLKTVPLSLHLVFTGNPGTGKTTVARILARLYKQIGVLSKGQLVECDRSGLVAGYVGQTAIRTQEKVQEAMGGVLFIDEAYTLAKEGQDFGQEAIDTILKAMEDNRSDLVVIVAGYPDLMQKFINSNPGLKSRFNKYFHFPDYNADELLEIFKATLSRYDYTISEEALKRAAAVIRYREAFKNENFANARDVRNLFEKIVALQASRTAALEDPDLEAMSLILPEDIPADGIPEAALSPDPEPAEKEAENTACENEA